MRKYNVFIYTEKYPYIQERVFDNIDDFKEFIVKVMSSDKLVITINLVVRTRKDK